MSEELGYRAGGVYHPGATIVTRSTTGLRRAWIVTGTGNFSLTPSVFHGYNGGWHPEALARKEQEQSDDAGPRFVFAVTLKTGQTLQSKELAGADYWNDSRELLKQVHQLSDLQLETPDGGVISIPGSNIAFVKLVRLDGGDEA